MGVINWLGGLPKLTEHQIWGQNNVSLPVNIQKVFLVHLIAFAQPILRRKPDWF